MVWEFGDFASVIVLEIGEFCLGFANMQFPSSKFFSGQWLANIRIINTIYVKEKININH